jgi:hypothetical protein
MHYLEQEHTKGVILNLANLVHIGHIGLGTLIAINNHIRNLKPHAFVRLGPEVEALVHKSHLERVMQIWTPDQPCLICGQPECLHKPELQKRLNEFKAKDYPIDESKIPHIGEKVVHTVPQPLVLDDAHPVAPKGGNKIGAIVIGLVIAGILVAGTWFTAINYATQGFPRGEQLSEEELLDKYDKTRDGKLTSEDLPLMNATERMNLSFSPWCKPLGLVCGSHANE